MTAQLVIDRLSIAVEGVPGIDPVAFRTALTRALGRIDLPKDMGDGAIARLTIPVLEARPGDTAERLAARAVDGLTDALARAGR
ncbi:MAG: hypothetical protein QNJ16_05415 [Rhodobacter sp.]|nr:hypothetical protein [Rhodobacter sp.]